MAGHSDIKIVSVGEVQPDVLDFLALTLSSSFGVPCEVCSVPIDTGSAYSVKRRQFDSNQILRQILKLPLVTEHTVLGVADVDLFLPIFTFVFGLAQVRGNAAVISTCRLRQTFYGLPEDNDLLLQRCEKEAAHELGHAYGLQHCSSYECVMHFSNSVEEVDLKSAMFCRSCSEVPAHTL